MPATVSKVLRHAWKPQRCGFLLGTTDSPGRSGPTTRVHRFQNLMSLPDASTKCAREVLRDTQVSPPRFPPVLGDQVGRILRVLTASFDTGTVSCCPLEAARPQRFLWGVKEDWIRGPVLDHSRATARGSRPGLTRNSCPRRRNVATIWFLHQLRFPTASA